MKLERSLIKIAFIFAMSICRSIMFDNPKTNECACSVLLFVDAYMKTITQGDQITAAFIAPSWLYTNEMK